MKLYDDARAPNPRRVRIFLAEKGIEVEKVPVAIATRANFEAAYLGVNKLGLLPALELDDGEVITESMAICRYFEELQPEPPLFGVGALERAKVEQWNRIAELELLFRVALAFQNTSPYWAGRREQVHAFGELERKRLVERFEFVDHALAGRDYLVGDSLTVADITLFVALDFARVIKVRVDEATPHLLAHYQRMGKRPSASV